jgi:hypothetical protein
MLAATMLFRSGIIGLCPAPYVMTKRTILSKERPESAVCDGAPDTKAHHHTDHIIAGATCCRQPTDAGRCRIRARVIFRFPLLGVPARTFGKRESPGPLHTPCRWLTWRGRSLCADRAVANDDAQDALCPPTLTRSPSPSWTTQNCLASLRLIPLMLGGDYKSRSQDSKAQGRLRSETDADGVQRSSQL